jgi:hypothetical protein
MILIYCKFVEKSIYYRLVEGKIEQRLTGTVKIGDCYA